MSDHESMPRITVEEANGEVRAMIAEMVARDFPEGYPQRTVPTTGCRRWGHHRNPTHGHCNRCGQEV